MRGWIGSQGLLVGLMSLFVAVSASPKPVCAQVPVPGTGDRTMSAGDDFEDESWEYTQNGAKSSREQDDQERWPIGQSTNGLWLESRKRGQPDVVLRVPTPPDGIPGSTGALKLRTVFTGVPNRPSREMQQDDFIMNVGFRTGGTISVQRYPSCVVRVYLPPFEEWENRTGASFGMRADAQTTTTDYESRRSGRGLFARSFRSSRKVEPYWPGMFIQFNSETDPGVEEDSAVFVVRSADSGHDFQGPKITETGWWTMGMSFTPDGRVHYFASPGVDDLTRQDHIASHFPYGFRCEQVNTIFFNIVNMDDGKTWSTEWIIDDPVIYWRQ